MSKSNEFSFSGEALCRLIGAVLGRKESLRFEVKGSSMGPFIKDGDIVTISPLNGSSSFFGKIVAFNNLRTKKLVIHRIIGKTGNRYILKGDNISDIDGLISRENILGAITRIERQDKELRLGLGRERVIVAFVSKMKLLPLIFRCWRAIPFSIRDFAKTKIR